MDAVKITQCGKPRTGKTTETEKVRNTFKSNGFGILIIDIKSEAVYQNAKTITIDQLAQWKGSGEYKVAFTGNFSIDKLFKTIQNNKKARNFLLILEDAKGYLNSTTSIETRAVIGACRQWGITLLANFWSMRQVPPFFADMTDILILRKTNDPVQKWQDLERFPHPDKLFKVYQEVSQSKDPYFAKRVKL